MKEATQSAQDVVNAKKFRFVRMEGYWLVTAFRKSTQKWEAFGTCHLLAKDAIKTGQVELIQMAH